NTSSTARPESDSARRTRLGMLAVLRLLRSCCRPLPTFDLRAMHDATFRRIEWIAPVHRATIVPQYEVADAPHVLPHQFFAVDVRPKFVQQRLGTSEIKPLDVRIAATAEIQHAAARFGVRAYQRMKSS